jgi:hypothetical protein
MSTFFSDCVPSKLKCCQCLYEKGTMQTWEKRMESYSPCYFAKHRIGSEHLYLRFYSMKDWVWSVSVWERKDENMTEKNRGILTVLFCKASARYWAPSVPILLDSRLSEVSVYMRNDDGNSREKNRVELTVLFLKASDRCWAPFSSISLSSRSSVVSVCVRKKIYKR